MSSSHTWSSYSPHFQTPSSCRRMVKQVSVTMEKASPKPFYYLLIVTALSRYKASSSWSTLWMCENMNHATSTVSVPDLPSPLKEDQCLKQLSKTMQELYIPCCYYCTFKNIVLREDQSTQPRMTNPHPTNLWFPSNCLGANGPWTK